MKTIMGNVNKIRCSIHSTEVLIIDLETTDLSFSIDNRSFKIETKPSFLKEGDELQVVFNPKNNDVYYWENRTRNIQKKGSILKATLLVLLGFFYAAFFFGIILFYYHKGELMRIIFGVLGVLSLMIPIISVQEFYYFWRGKKMIQSRAFLNT